MKKIHLLPVLLLFLAVACKENTTVAPSLNLIGTWDWILTTGGLAGVHQTPASTGQTAQIVLNADSTYKIFNSDKLTNSGTYRVYSAGVLGDSQNLRTMIFFSNLTEPDAITLKGDTLSLDPGCCDQFGTLWKRRGAAPVGPNNPG